MDKYTRETAGREGDNECFVSECATNSEKRANGNPSHATVSAQKFIKTTHSPYTACRRARIDGMFSTNSCC